MTTRVNVELPDDGKAIRVIVQASSSNGLSHTEQDHRVEPKGGPAGFYVHKHQTLRIEEIESDE